MYQILNIISYIYKNNRRYMNIYIYLYKYEYAYIYIYIYTDMMEFLPAALQSISTTCPVQTHLPTFCHRINLVLATWISKIPFCFHC